MDVSKTGKAINIANLSSGTGKVNEAILTKTHISQVKGKAIDQLAQQRANALAVFITQSEARMDKARELSAHLDELHQTYDGLESEFTAAQKGVDSATDEVAQAQRKLDEAQNSLAELLEQLGVTDPDDPSFADDPDVTQAKKEIADAQKALGLAQSTLSDAHAIAEQKRAAMQSVLNEINASTAEMNKKYSDVDIAPKGGVVSSNAMMQSEKALTKTAVMIMLITEFIMQMEEASAEKLKNDLELNCIQTKARQAEMQRKSDEYEE
ncbi:MAG: hypothetical protein ACMZI0_03695 [Symbiopectobacterium sp.]|uniref:hypothetical protein n=1 Tax=Symbiopectobacterium sp. TaxID=2952789 RepID=UPI0039ECE72E